MSQVELTDFRATHALWKFFVDAMSQIGFNEFVTDVTKTIDAVRYIAAAALEGQRVDDNELSKVKGKAQETLERYSELLLQLLFCRAVDNFLSYISDLLSTIFRHRHETLHAFSGSIPISEVLKYRDMDDLIASLSEQKVHELSYKGLEDLSEFLSSRLGFPLFELQDDLRRAVILVEQRNIIVHNRGVVNKVVLAKHPNIGLQLGDKVTLSRQDLNSHIRFLVDAALDVDMRAVDKFDLETTETVPWQFTELKARLQRSCT